MTIDIPSIITLALAIALVLILARFFVRWIGLAITIAIFLVLIVFILDFLQGGTAFQQVADYITAWLRQHFTL